MNNQIDLEGQQIPVQRTEKVTTTVKFEADYFKLSLSEEKLDKIKEFMVTGEKTKADEIILKALKAHRGIPDTVVGRAFQDDFRKIKAAIIEEPVDAEMVLDVTSRHAEGEEEEKAALEGRNVPQLMSPEEGQKPPEKEDEEMKSLIEDLLTRDDGIQDYLVNNFKPAVISKLAEKLHVALEEDELPQKTAFKIAVTIEQFKNKKPGGR